MNCDSVSKISFFNQVTEENNAKQSVNVFSENWEQIRSNRSLNKKNKAKLVYNEKTRLMEATDQSDYGITKNDKSYKRGVKANNQIHAEVKELCEIIASNGYKLTNKPDSLIAIKFKSLFNMYTVISNKLVGVLLRARKHGYVDFKGEILFQARDDHVQITLLKVPEQ